MPNGIFKVLDFGHVTKYVVILVLVTTCTGLSAQVNIKIGYNLGFPQLSVNDEILSMWQPADSEVIESFGSIGFMHGIQLGMRYRMGSVAAEIGWESVSRDRTALAYKSSTDTFSDRQYNYSISGLSFGLDNYFSRFGVGSTLIYQKLGIDRAIGNNNLSLVSDRQWALRLQFIWQVQESRLVSLMIKPYYQFSLKGHNLSPLASDLNVSDLTDTIETPKMFGITLIFYNGRQ